MVKFIVPLLGNLSWANVFARGQYAFTVPTTHSPTADELPLDAKSHVMIISFVSGLTHWIVYVHAIAAIVTLIVSPALNPSSQKFSMPAPPTSELYLVGFCASTGYPHVIVSHAHISTLFPTGVPQFTFFRDVPDTRDSTRVIPPCHVKSFVVLLQNTKRSII